MKTNEDKNTRLVRIYQYSDPYKGWGDGGTIGYIRLNESDFTKKEMKRIDDSSWIKTTMNHIGRQKVMDTFSDKVDQSGYGHWGWENADVEDIEKERMILQSKLKALEIK